MYIYPLYTRPDDTLLYIYIYIHIYISLSLYIYIYIYIHNYIYIYIYIHLHLSFSLSIYIYIYIYMYEVALHYGLLSLTSPAVPPSLVQSLFSLCLLFLPVFSLCPPLPLCFPLARSVPVLLVFGYGFGLVWFLGFPEGFYKTKKSLEKTKNTKENPRKPNKH